MFTEHGTQLALSIVGRTVLHGPRNMVAANVRARLSRLGALLFISAADVIYLTAVIAAFTFCYLLAAMIRPEHF
jgi:hypothetical protein